MARSHDDDENETCSDLVEKTLGHRGGRVQNVLGCVSKGYWVRQSGPCDGPISLV